MKKCCLNTHTHTKKKKKKKKKGILQKCLKKKINLDWREASKMVSN